ncbi:MAG: transposase [Terriglobia bacterium]
MDRPDAAGNRSAGAFLGLRPGQSQSGESDPQRRISKTGDSYPRRRRRVPFIEPHPSYSHSPSMPV